MAKISTIGVVICGGAGERLGGVIKPLLRADRRTILDTTIERLRKDISLVIAAVGNHDATRFVGSGADALVFDQPGVSGGPLAGLFSALAFIGKRDWAPETVLTVAGDCPDLPPDLRDRLANRLSADRDVVFGSYAGQAYPPNALWRFDALCKGMDALGGDPQGRGPRHLIAPERRADLDFSAFSELNPFEGFNTRSDLVARARRKRAEKNGSDLPKSGLGKASQTR